MTGNRHESIGIKQVIRYEWMQKTANLLLTGLDAQTIRHELHELLTDQKGSGSEGERSDQTRAFAVNNLMKMWVSPNPELLIFRDAALAYLRKHQSMGLAVHWAMVSAAYPFWFNVAKQVGRLLNLQDRITQPQIFNRLKEQYGDREIVARNARYVVRSFVAWGVLRDSCTKGCYEKVIPTTISDQDLTILMFRAALHTTPDGKDTLRHLLSNPSFFPFHLPVVNSGFITQYSGQIEVIRLGIDEEILRLMR
jgi:hypothetical protein